MINLGTRVLLAAAIVAIVALAPSAYAVLQFRQIERTFDLASAAGDVRRSLEDVEDASHEYAHFIEAGGDPEADLGRRLLGTAVLALSRTRQLVAKEIGLIGAGGAAEEGDEITLIDGIESELRAARRGKSKSWDPLIQRATKHELSELQLNEAEVARMLRRIKLMFMLQASIAVIATVLAYFFLSRSIVIPLQRLVVGSGKFAAGDFDSRIEPGGVKELGQTIVQFNKMAEQVNLRQSEMNSANEDLEEEVARRTEELRGARDQMRELAAKRADFLADISHELRTPIAIVRGEAEVTLRNRQASEAEFRESLRRVQRQAEALSELVDDLLFVARNDSGAPALKLARCDLGAILKDGANDVRSLIVADGGAISVRGIESAAMLLADRTRLCQVLRILIDNAIRYCAREPLIDISLNRAPGGYLVEVRDNGVGIARDEIERVFERFQRGANVRDDGKGSGLGLPLANAIVAAHGGTLTCASTPGEGTTMSFLIPSGQSLRAVA